MPTCTSCDIGPTVSDAASPPNTFPPDPIFGVFVTDLTSAPLHPPQPCFGVTVTNLIQSIASFGPPSDLGPTISTLAQDQTPPGLTLAPPIG